MRYIKYFLLSFLIVFLGCTTVPKIKSIEQLYSQIERKKMMDTIQFVLLENGYQIANINDTYGTITTEWKSLNNQADNIGLTLLTSSRYSTSMYQDLVLLTIYIKDDRYIVYPKTTRQKDISNTLVTSSSRTNSMLIKSGSTAETIVLDIMIKINEELRIYNKFNIIEEGKAIEQGI